MKHITVLLIFLLITSVAFAQKNKNMKKANTGAFHDKRDGQNTNG